MPALSSRGSKQWCLLIDVEKAITVVLIVGFRPSSSTRPSILRYKQPVLEIFRRPPLWRLSRVQGCRCAIVKSQRNARPESERGYGVCGHRSQTQYMDPGWSVARLPKKRLSLRFVGMILESFVENNDAILRKCII